MSNAQEEFPLRTIFLIAVAVPVIGYLINFAYRKNTESAARAQQCREECTAQGHPGYDFKWDVLGGPQCECIGDGTY